MQEDDVYFVVDAKHIDRAKAVLGLDEGVYENIVIFGGGKIGKYLCEKIEERGKFSSCTMIEKNHVITSYSIHYTKLYESLHNSNGML